MDFRSDQFSLGTILYEMAAGRKAFERDSAAETLTAIIREEAEPLLQAAPRLPAPLRWIVERCLAKDPEERYASTKDLARELEMLGRRLSEATGSGETAAVAGDATGDRFPTFQRLTFRRGTILSSRFAPDGQTVIYGAAWDGQPCRLFSTRPESPESSALALPEAEILSVSTTGQMALSLDRHWAGRFVWSGILAQAPLLGGAPREVLEDVQWADWGPDGASLAVVRRAGGKSRVEYPVGTTLFETAGWLSHVRVSPDGERVAFLHHPTQGDDGGSVMSVDRGGARATTHSEDWITAYGLAWRTPSEIWFTATRVGVARAIWSVNVAGGRERLLARTPGELTIQDVARDGRTLVTSDNGMVGIMGVPPGESEERDLSLLDWSLVRDISKDGRLILFDETGEGGGNRHACYVRRTDGSPAIRLGEGGGASSPPTDDGRSRARSRRRKGSCCCPCAPARRASSRSTASTATLRAGSRTARRSWSRRTRPEPGCACSSTRSTGDRPGRSPPRGSASARSRSRRMAGTWSCRTRTCPGPSCPCWTATRSPCRDSSRTIVRRPGAWTARPSSASGAESSPGAFSGWTWSREPARSTAS